MLYNIFMILYVVGLIEFALYGRSTSIDVRIPFEQGTSRSSRERFKHPKERRTWIEQRVDHNNDSINPDGRLNACPGFWA